MYQPSSRGMVWYLRHSIEMDAFNEIESIIYRLWSVSVSCPCDIGHCAVILGVSQSTCPRVLCCGVCVAHWPSKRPRDLCFDQIVWGFRKPKQQTVFNLNCLTLFWVWITDWMSICSYQWIEASVWGCVVLCLPTVLTHVTCLLFATTQLWMSAL